MLNKVYLGFFIVRLNAHYLLKIYGSYVLIYMKKLFLLLLALMYACGIFAQPVVTGSVKDASGAPIAYANAVMMNVGDSSFVEGCMSNDAGVFTFTSLSTGNFILKLSYLGYTELTQDVGIEREKTDLGVFVMHESATGLDEVTVTANRLQTLHSLFSIKSTTFVLVN